MWNLIRRKILQIPPPIIAFFWRRLLLMATGRLLRKTGVERLVCYDIGARWGIWSRFYRLPLPIFKVGFEADPEEAKRLVKSGAFDIVIPVALSAEGGERVLHLAQEPGSSSIYGPDMEIIAQHCGTEEYEVVRKIPLPTIALHQAIADYKLPPPDFVKLDVEGAESEILTGLGKYLADCSGIIFEARLAPFYPGETLFGGIATQLFQHGFSVTSFEPVGCFHGAIVLVDASACRSHRSEARRQQLLKAAAFALLVDNFEFALACLRKVATKREILFG